MPSKRKQTQEPEPTEAEMMELDALLARLPPDARLDVCGETLDGATARERLALLMGVARAKREYEAADAKLRAIRPEAEAYVSALKEIPELRDFCK